MGDNLPDWRVPSETLRDPDAAEQMAKDMLTDGHDNEFFSVAARLIFAAVVRELVRLRRPWTLRLAYHFAMNEFYARQLFERSPDAKTTETLGLFDDKLGSTKANIRASLRAKLWNVATYAALMENCKGSCSMRDLALRPLTPDEADMFDLVFDPNGYRP